jgi:hypothetical protein
MTYKKLTLWTSAILPLTAFCLVFIVMCVALWKARVGLGMVLGGSLGLGVCAVIILYVLAAPLNARLLTRELKTSGSPEQLAAWITREPHSEFYVGSNGAWHNGKRYYWAHSLNLALEDVCLKRTRDGVLFILKLSETLDKSARYFQVEVPVPSGQEALAEHVALRIIQDNTILDDHSDRKQAVTWEA